MKYLFSLHDNSEGVTELISVEAEDEIQAGNILASKFMPRIARICYGPFVRAMEELDIIVDSLGSMNEIKELS